MHCLLDLNNAIQSLASVMCVENINLKSGEATRHRDVNSTQGSTSVSNELCIRSDFRRIKLMSLQSASPLTENLAETGFQMELVEVVSPHNPSQATFLFAPNLQILSRPTKLYERSATQLYHGFDVYPGEFGPFAHFL